MRPISGIVFISSLALFACQLFAQDGSPWTNESELSVVSIGGNSQSESYSAKQKTSYKFNSNIFTGFGRYLQTTSGSTETGKQWEASLRFEKEFSEKWSAFVQQGAESNFYAGYVQRENTDLGGKYYFIKEDAEKLFMESGLRYIKDFDGTYSAYSNSGRIYFEYSKKFNESVFGKFWTEYLSNLKDSDAYQLNWEPSLSVMMNQVFSLKAAYLVKFHNKEISPADKRQDTTFTTSIVAKF
jgi:putative salt-induced outer membrane protein